MNAVEELDALYAYTSSTPRKRERVESRYAGTYADGVYAIMYARAGAPTRARETLVHARDELRDVLSDPLHYTMLAVIEERVEQALDKRSWDTLSAARLDELDALDRVHRYKLERAFETTSVLGPPSDVTSIVAWENRATPSRRLVSSLNRVRTTDLAEMVLARIEVAGGVELDDALAALPGLEEADAMTGAIVAIPRIATTDPARRAVFAGRVLAACGRFGWGELAPELTTLFFADLDLSRPDHFEAAHTAVAVLGAFGDDEPLARLANMLAFETSEAFDLLRVAAEAWLGRSPGEALRGTWNHRRMRSWNLDRARRVGRAVAAAPPSPDHLRDFRAEWPQMTDEFGTNSHFCITGLSYVDIVAGAIVSSASLRPSSSS